MNALIVLAVLLFAPADRALADGLFDQGRWPEARAAYEGLLEEAGDDAQRADLLDRIGRTLFFEGDLWAAEARFADAIELDERGLFHLHRGAVYYHAAEQASGPGSMGAGGAALMTDARRAFERALELDGSLADAAFYLGRCESFDGSEQAEEAAYRRAQEARPGHALAAWYLAALLERRGSLAAAREALEAVAPEERYLAHWLSLGRVSGALGDAGREGEACRQAVLRFPDEDEGYQLLWSVTGYRKRFADFEAVMGELLEAHPEAWLPRYYLGFCRRYAGDPEGAMASFEAAVAREPGEARALVQIAEIRREDLRDVEGSIPFYLRALEVDPANERARQVLSGLALEAARSGGLERARKLLETVREVDPSEWSHTLNLALVEKEAGNVERAVELYEEAEAAFPFEPQIPNDRGLLLMGLGRREEAMAAFRSSLERDPEFLDALENLGAYTLLAGDAAGSIEFFRRAWERARREGADLPRFRRYLDEAAREVRR